MGILEKKKYMNFFLSSYKLKQKKYKKNNLKKKDH